MWKYKPFMIGVLGVLLLGGSVQAATVESRPIRLASLATSQPVPAASFVSGEISWVDVNLGKLQLKEEGLRGDWMTTEYRINQQATNVTDPSDRQFLTLEDLRSGQQVRIEFESANNYGEQMARKITVVSTPPEPEFVEQTTTTTTTTSVTTTR